MKNTFYITTTLPYVNADPHIGFASEIVCADVLARYKTQKNFDVVFNTGTDEHGQKIYVGAQDAGLDPQEYTDRYAKSFEVLKEQLNLSYTNFIRTTNADHMQAAQEMWRRCDASGDIYKKLYKVKYCIGCELEKTDSELEDGTCPIHPKMELDIREEENYFFRFSKYQDDLLKLYEEHPDFVYPKKRLNEIREFVSRGLEDFSISRLQAKMPWGVPVPDDDEHVMYVWFDALTNYISTVGWPDDQERFEKYWPGVQIAGKDNLRQQSAMWQAMLLSAKLPLSTRIYINGFISVDGQKMSKSLGNVISPKQLVDSFGVDGARYLLLSKSNFGEDSDISWERFVEKYNADLANGLGNLVSRVVALGTEILTTYDDVQFREIPQKWEFGETNTPTTESIKDVKSARMSTERVDTLATQYAKLYETMEYREILERIWKIVQEQNTVIEQQKPWELKKSNPEEFVRVMNELFASLEEIAFLLQPLLPETSEKMMRALETGQKVALFERVEQK